MLSLNLEQQLNQQLHSAYLKIINRKVGREEANKRIYATTDASKGALKTLATSEGYESFIVPDNVGGRFSVLTAVGLLPIAVSGINIEDMMRGANDARAEYANPNLAENEAYQYAVIRNALYSKGKTIEMLINYEPALLYFNEWWKQLFGESEGKDQKESSQHLLHSQQIYTQWDNIFKKVVVTSSKQL